MCNPTPTVEHPPAPLGHSQGAHRLFGWCCHCRGHDPAEEVAAWRGREYDRRAAERAALAASAAQTSHVDLQAHQDRPCPSCGREALTVVTVTLVEGRVRKTVGGWAYCTECDHVPAACYCQPGDTPYLAMPVPTTEKEHRG
ncbi:hypothetical protein [Streptomyces sp. NPDC088847]|uniref:hypothetical protein n=1 Tax=Streptomyces sp. NPDC088847 TaxID=3365909 RepID=UPI0038158057